MPYVFAHTLPLPTPTFVWELSWGTKPDSLSGTSVRGNPAKVVCKTQSPPREPWWHLKLSLFEDESSLPQLFFTALQWEWKEWGGVKKAARCPLMAPRKANWLVKHPGWNINTLIRGQTAVCVCLFYFGSRVCLRERIPGPVMRHPPPFLSLPPVGPVKQPTI